MIINASVGQGKTFSIINIVKRYYENGNYLIFIASPFVSLVQQYFDKIRESGVPASDIYRYESIGTDTHLDAWNSPIQIVTINLLLGNPGENRLINSENKRAYINYLVEKCERFNKKVVFIYDEVHDAIHNFKEEFIFNLWKWRNVIHKNIILSATYNEASKVVIEYLAELTENKIQIIESIRRKYPEKQSDLYLLYNRARNYRHDNDKICSLVSNLIAEGKNFDILCYSKALADNICENNTNGIGAILLDAGIDVQNCTSDLEDSERMYSDTPSNRYDPTKCNIGTNFKTGVSIEKENHAYIIIMPPLGAKGKFKNKYGIFSGGVNTVIQALARQRKKGEIYLILPPPGKFDYNSLNFPSVEQKQVFIEFYSSVNNTNDSTEETIYLPINNQELLLADYYNNKLKFNVLDAIDYVNGIERESKVRLQYPEYKLFKLEKGEQYLSSEINFFGKDLSSYITYCAITNQFVNCTLKGANISTIYNFRSGKLQYKFEQYYSDYMDEGLLNSLYLQVSDKYKYLEFKKDLFSEGNRITFTANPEDNAIEISSFQVRELEIQLVAFLQRHFYPQNRSFARRFDRNGYLIDSEYSRGEYFLSCIAHSLRLRGTPETLQGDTRELVEAYTILNSYRYKLVQNIQTGIKNGETIQYLFNQPFEGFISNHEYEEFNLMINILCEKDILIANDVFEFKRRMSNNNVEQRIKSFYKYLIQDYLEFVNDTFYQHGSQVRIKRILNVFEVPRHNMVIDFVSQATPIFSERYNIERDLQTLLNLSSALQNG